jgi:hypothetical protein
VGVLRVAGSASQPSHQDLLRGLRDLGYIEGQNVVIEFRSAEGRLELLPELAAELVRLKVAVIVAYGPQTIQAAKDATTTIPIVMGRMDDADAHGFGTNRGAGHETPRFHNFTRRRNGWMVIPFARATEGDAGGRLPQQRQRTVLPESGFDRLP